MARGERNAAMGDFVTSQALIVFSGGQDSTTCLYWAFREFCPEVSKRRQNIKTVTFDYGQKHHKEIEAAQKICNLAGVDFDLVKIPEVLRSASPLISENELETYSSLSEVKPGVQKTFIPGRNILFLTIAANLAYHHGINNIVTGVCQEDFGGYYDCREDFIRALEPALNQGLFGKNQGLKIHTPLMNLNKKETVLLAKELGDECLGALAHSHTCYAGRDKPCLKCHACLLRQRGFQEAGVRDPLLNELSN